jgi:hypothetical protein
MSMPKRDDGRPDPLKAGYLERRRAKIRSEIERNRRGEYNVPTWVLAAALVAVVVIWLVLILIS